VRKEILLVGGSGFLGLNLIKSLRKNNNYRITSVSRIKPKIFKRNKNLNFIKADFSNYTQIKKKLKKKNFNIIINFGGNINHDNKNQIEKSHFTLCSNLVRFFNNKKIDLFIQAGSSMEYGLAKSPNYEKSKCKPKSYYGASKLKSTESYVVALDPSMGTGGDYAAIQVYEIPAYKQVAEWRHNETPIPAQIRILKDITTYIQQQCGDANNIYWSVENNAIGEAALIVINDFGEENIPGLFISEPIRKGHVRKFRKGFNTTHGTKITACSRLKTMVENDQLILTSKALITELKNFVATGTSFRAKVGQTDDLISATLLALRMMNVLKDWDPRIYNTFTQADGDEVIEPPMPIYVTGGLG